MTEQEKIEKLEQAKELLVALDSSGGKRLIDLIEETIKTIPGSVEDFFGTSAAGMSLDTTRIAFSAGGRVYLKEVLRRIDEIKEFVKKIALEKESDVPKQ